MANQVLRCLQDLYKLAAIRDDYTTHDQILAVICNLEALLLSSSGIAPSGSDLDVYLSNLFNTDNGLPAFISKYFHVKTIQPCLQQMFQLILGLLQNYINKVIQYAPGIKDVCLKGVLSGDTSAKCKEYCYLCLQELIAHYSLQTAWDAEALSKKLFEHLAKSKSKLSSTEIQYIYVVFGLLGKHSLCTPGDLIRALCDGLGTREVQAGKPKLLECCLTGLSDLLSNHELKVFVQTDKGDWRRNIYNALKAVAMATDIGRVHTAFRASLKLFSDHFELWAPLVIPEYVLWHSKLTQFLATYENEDDKRVLEEAIDKFYVLVSRNGSGSLEIYKYFMDYFDKEMSSLHAVRRKITVKGLSHFVHGNVPGSGPSRQLFSTMFGSFLQRTLFLSLELQKLEQGSLESNARLVSNYLNLLCKLQVSLSQNHSECAEEPRVVQLNSSQSDNSLLHICVNLVTLYPQLDYTSRMEVSKEVTGSLTTLYKNRNSHGLLREFLYQSIIRTCSHDLIFDADNLPDHSLVTFRVYLPLWKQLLNNSNTFLDGIEFADFILDEMITCLVLLSHKLDLNLSPDAELSESTFLPSLSHTYLQDPATHLSPSNTSDVALFTNLVDFYSELLLSHVPVTQADATNSENGTRVTRSDVENGPANVSPSDSSDENTAPMCALNPLRLVSVLKEIIAVSMCHSVVGGLYSLCTLLLRLSRQAGCFEDEALVRDLTPLMNTYLDQVINISIQHQQELHYTSLSLILACPLCFIPFLLPRLVQPFQSIFQLGLNDLHLAQSGLNTLIYWYTHLPSASTRDFIAPLILSLAPYLKSRDTNQDSVLYSESERALLSSKSGAVRSLAQKRRKLKLIESYDQCSELRLLQTSILYFLTVLDSNLSQLIVSQRDNREVLSEETSRRLLFSVPFLTSKVPMHLDIFMDHLIDLASSSSNRRVRVAACELLHGTALLLLGNNKQDGSRRGNERDEMFEKILPVIIKLGCDGDMLIRQLYSDLAIQLTHYYSSELQLYSSHSQFVITLLMDNITQDSHTELRNFSTRLLSEFLAWTRKQSLRSSDPSRRDTKVNMTAVVKRLQQCCVHPAKSKRVGAAIAFNSIYKILREEATFVDTHWLELYFYFVQNLALCTTPGDHQILCESISHLNRVVKEKSQVFNAKNTARSKPPRFETLTLGSFVRFLYEYLTQSNALLRSTVQKIIGELTRGAAPFRLDTEVAQIQDRLEAQLTGGPSMSNVNRVLENYLWLISHSQENAKIVANLLAGDSKLLIILHGYLNDFIPPPQVTLAGETIETSQANRPVANQLIVNMLKLTAKLDTETMQALLDLSKPDVSGGQQRSDDVSKRLINRRFLRLIALCMFQPHLFGFNSEQRKELKWVMDQLLNYKCRSLGELAKVLFEMIYTDFVQVESIQERIMEPYVTRQKRVEDKQRSYLEAIILIQESGLFPFYIECINDSLVDTMVDSLFESSQFCTTLFPDLLEYTKLLFKFLRDNMRHLRKLIDCMTDARPRLGDASTIRETKGPHFFTLFRPMLTQLLLNSLSQLESLLLTQATAEKFSILIHLIESVAAPSRDIKNSVKLSHEASSILFKSTALTHWTTLSSHLNPHQLISLLLNIVHVKPQPGYLADFDQVVKWYLAGVESSSLSYHDKLSLLKLLPSFLPNTMSTSEDTTDLTSSNGDSQMFSNGDNQFSSTGDNQTSSNGAKSHLSRDEENSEEMSSSLNRAEEIPLETRLVASVQSLLQPLAQEDSTENRLCDWVLVFAELTRALPRCLNWALFKLLVQFHCQYSVQCELDKSENRLDFDSCFPSLLNSLSPAHHTRLIQSLYARLTQPYANTPNNGRTETQYRHAMLNTVLLPLLRDMFRRSTSCVEFYCGEMLEQILTVLSVQLDGETMDEDDVRDLERALLRKLIHVRIMEGILHVPKADLAAPMEAKRKDVMIFVYRNLLKCNGRFDQSDYCARLTCELHTAAYVMFCIYICNTATDINAYALLFKEDPAKEKYIFKHLLPSGKDFHFPIEFSVLPKQKKLLTSIRCESKQTEEFRTSVDLFSSSLVDDVTRHDFTSTKILRSWGITNATTDSSSNTLSFSLELDEINSHEAMQAMTGVIHHLMNSGLFSKDQDEPPWFTALLSCLEDPGQARNVKVWLLKLVVNNSELFGHFAATLYPVLMRIITQGTLGSHINYFLSDLLLVMLSWNSTALPPTNMMHDFLAFLFKIIPHEKATIFNYNLEIVRNMLAVWSPILTPSLLPHSTIHSMLLSSNPLCQLTGLKLSELIVKHDLPPYNSNTERDYLKMLGDLFKKSLKDAKAKDAKSSKHSSESDVLAQVLGGLLRLFHSPDEATRLQDVYNIERALQDMLERMKAGDAGYVRTVYHIASAYPAFADAYKSRIISTYPQLPSDYQNYCLSLLGIIYTRNRTEDMWTVLKQIGVLEVLNNKQHKLLLPVLKLLSCIKLNLNQAALQALLPAIARHADDNLPLIRTQVYEFMFHVFHCWVLEEEEEGMEWGEEGRRESLVACKEVVVKGLLDEDQTLQEKNFARLAEHYRNTFPEDLFSQLLRNLYVPSMESHLLNLVSYFLLDLTRNSADYSSPLFSHPLEICNYREHHLRLSYRHKNLTYAPLFINSLTSQVLGLSAATVSSSRSIDASGMYKLQLRETGSSLEFDPTLQSNEGEDETDNFAAPSDDGVFLVPSPPYSSGSQSLIRNQFFTLRRRFHRNPQQHKRDAVRRNTSMKMKRSGLQKDKQKLKGAQVSLTRSYRTGDFPDIQISFSSVLEPLKSLCLRDSSLSRLLILSLYDGLSRESVELREKTRAQFKRILEQGMNDPSVTSLILEIFTKQKINDDVVNINQVACTSGLMYHGICLIENKLMANLPKCEDIRADFGSAAYTRNKNENESAGTSNKRCKKFDENLVNSCFTELIDLYKNIDESDIIIGILSQQNSSDLKKAIDSELSNNYRKARKHYEACLDSHVLSTAIIRDGYYRTFHELAKWAELEQKLGEEVEGDWHGVWSKGTYVVKNLLRCQILNSRTPSVDFVAAFKMWTECNVDHFYSLKLHHAQDTSIIHLLLSQYPQSVSMSELNLNQQLLRWICRSADVLNNSMVAIETALVGRTLQSATSDNVARLSHVWDLKCSRQEDLATLQLRVTLRDVFLNRLGDTDLSSTLASDLHTRHIHNHLRLIDAALNRNRFYMAREQLKRLYSESEADYGKVIRLYHSRVELLSCAEIKNLDQKVDKLVATWTSLGDAVDYEESDQLKLGFYKHIHVLSTSLFDCLEKHEYTLTEHSRNSLHDLLVPYGIDLGDYDMRHVQAQMFHIVVDGLKRTIVNTSSVELGDDMCASNGESYLLLAEYVKSHAALDPAFPADAAFIESLLRSIRCGTLKARQLFPLLLQMPSILEHGALFSDIVRDIPAWMFLSWLNQIFAYLDQEIGTLLLPIVERLATLYPSAVKLPFNINAHRYAQSSDTDLLGLIDRLKFTPQEASLYDRLSKCTLPGSLLKQHLEQISYVDPDSVEQLQVAVNALHADCFIVRPGYNEAIVAYCSKHYKNLVTDAFRTVQGGRLDANLNDKLKNLFRAVDEEERKKRNWDLKQISPYLSSYGVDGSAAEIEMPGQYGGVAFPHPELHVKIAQFKSNIRVMQSLKKPIQINILGNDGREYPWLVKHNEDLRSDERLQAVFSLYNSALQSESPCASRELSLATYRVVPLNRNSGMIQWVPNTRVLGELYQTKGLTKDWLNKDLGSPYQKFHEKGKKHCPHSVQYDHSMKMKSREEVIDNYLTLANKLPKSSLRDGLLDVATSPENRIRIRNNFLRSYATMCIAHYTLGIGDRHLENTLVCAHTGRVIGIDFGMSFGVATQLLPIPELMPFRLTPHIVAINDPYATGGLIRESMVRVLSCLRSHSDVILCTLQVFIREPCSDWLVMLRRKLLRDGELSGKEIEKQGNAYMEWYPEAKVKVAEQKLNGLSSIYIMNQELQLRPPSSQVVCSRIVTGTPECLRSKYDSDSSLSVRDQVDCLLDHATDAHILGVTWVGWSPYV